MFEGCLDGKSPSIGLVKRRCDLRSAIGSDAGDKPLDGLAILRLADGHLPLKRIVEDQDANEIDLP